MGEGWDGGDKSLISNWSWYKSKCRGYNSHLYLDGEWAGDDRYQGGPANPIERLSINNNESDPAAFPTFSVVDELTIHDDQKDDDAVRALFESVSAVDPEEKLATI